MSQTHSQAVRDRIQTVESFLYLVRGHELVVSEPLARVLSLDEIGLDGSHVMELHLHALEQAMEDLVAADEALVLEAADDKQYRDARDAGVKGLRETLVDVRNLLEAAYGTDVLAHYLLVGDLPRSPELVKERAEEVLNQMRQRPLTESSPYGFDLDLSLLADRIETEVVPLSMALEDIKREVREIQEALQHRNTVMSRFDQVFESVSQVMHAYYKLSGRPDLAMTVG